YSLGAKRVRGWPLAGIGAVTALRGGRRLRVPAHRTVKRRRAATPYRGDRPARGSINSLVVRTVVVVLQRHRLARTRAERRVVDVVVADGRVHRGLGLLGRLDPDVAVAGQTRTGRDELTDDDVLLEADEAVGLGVDRRVRQDS